jgi:hypothetical protein
VFAPPGPGADLATSQHHLVRTYPAGQPAGDGQRAAAVWGPRAALPSAAHARQAPAHAASSLPAPPAASHHPAAPGMVAGDYGAHPEEGGGPRQVERTEPRPAAPAGSQFSWFAVDHGACYSSGKQG